MALIKLRFKRVAKFRINLKIKKLSIRIAKYANNAYKKLLNSTK